MNKLQIVFQCPECNKSVKMKMKKGEAEDIKKRISAEGRSPTMIVKCPQGHELLVTLYIKEGELAARDIVVPMKIKTKKDDKKKAPSEIDWLKDAFGGEG